MLYLFLSNHRETLVNRCLQKVAARSEPTANPTGSQYGIPMFLSQLIETLRLETDSGIKYDNSIHVSGPAGGPSALSDVGKSATLHGRELSEHGFTIEQVVHDYGDLCQAIGDLASEMDHPIENEEFRTLNRCLDNGIADAVTEFSQHRHLVNADREEQNFNRRMGSLVHEMRAHLNAATHSLSVLKTGQVGFAGATGAVLDRSLAGMRTIINRSFAEACLVAGLPANHQVIFMEEFIANIKDTAEFEARARECEFSATVVGLGLAVEADEDLLSSAVINLLQNAFKFTHIGTRVSLTAYAEGNVVRIDVQDHCGGLGLINKEDLFTPFKRMGPETSGAGLGLSICRRSVEANRGQLSVRDIPGSGCVFTISLPRYELPATGAQSLRRGADQGGVAADVN